MWADVCLIVGAYLLGGSPQLALLARIRRVKLQGDYHEGLWDRAGKTFGVLGVIGEFVKGAAPVLAGKWLDFNQVTVIIAGVAVVCGQMWPVYNRFDGEKGNSIGIGMLAALNPLPTVVALAFPLIALIVRTVPRLKTKEGEAKKRLVGGAYSRSLPVGMALFFLSQLFLSWYFHKSPEIIWGTAALFLLIEIRRLTAGLKRDLAASRDIKSIIAKRLLYDRATAPWRKENEAE
jgi:acyl phosphate:glycerol-3-phosphate acyltransferase